MGPLYGIAADVTPFDVVPAGPAVGELQAVPMLPYGARAPGLAEGTSGLRPQDHAAHASVHAGTRRSSTEQRDRVTALVLLGVGAVVWIVLSLGSGPSKQAAPSAATFIAAPPTAPATGNALSRAHAPTSVAGDRAKARRSEWQAENASQAPEDLSTTLRRLEAGVR